MTVAEKRNALQEYCNGHTCSSCELKGNICSCGMRHMFETSFGSPGYMTDAEIIGAYELVFGSTETVTINESVTLETAVDNSIVISGVDKIQSISIYFKEEVNA